MPLITYPVLKIHSWGGLGSQLYAFATAMQIQASFPKRKIVLMIHTGGVTKRDIEILPILNNFFELERVDDYSISEIRHSQSAVFREKIFKFFNKFGRALLIFSGLLSLANTEKELLKTRPWVLSIRGHYFYRPIDGKFLEFLIKQLSDYRELGGSEKYRVAIHYRMGDLLKLKQKSFVPVVKIVEVIKKVAEFKPDVELLVYSDSPNEAKTMLKNAGVTQEISLIRASTIQVLGQCLDVDFFIGTSSKVSLWIVNMRRFLGRAEANFLEGFDQQLYKSK